MPREIPLPDVEAFLKWLMSLGPEGLVICFSVIIAYGVRRTKRLNNGWVFPASIAVGILLYECMGSSMPDHPWWDNVARNFIRGTVLSSFGGLLGVGIHNRALKPLARQFPLLKFLACDDEDAPAPPPPPPESQQ